MMRSKLGRTLAALPAVFTAALVVASGLAQADSREPVELRFLNISDWHAQLDPLFVFGVGSFGGAAELSTYFQMERLDNPNTLTLTAGDAYGASPPLSSFFDEIPAAPPKVPRTWTDDVIVRLALQFAAVASYQPCGIVGCIPCTIAGRCTECTLRHCGVVAGGSRHQRWQQSARHHRHVLGTDVDTSTSRTHKAAHI